MTAEDTGPSAVPAATPVRLGWDDVPVRLWIAVVAAVAGAVLVAVGPLAGVIANGPAAAYSSGPLLILLAVLPVLLAVGLLVAGRLIGAAGVLVGVALLAPGRLLIDLQFAVDALVASRPELMVPTSLAQLSPGAGTWLLVVGHLLTVAAGACVVSQAGAKPGSAVAAEFDDAQDPTAMAHRRRLLGWGLAFGGVATIGLIMPPFVSDNAFLLANDLLNGPTLVLAGGLLIAASVVLGCVIAGTSRALPLSRGVLLGLAFAILAVVLPAQAAGAVVDWLHTDWRSYLATAGALGLIATAVWPSGLRRAEREKAERPAERTANRARLAAGVLAVLAGLAAIGGRVGDLFVYEVPTDQPINLTDFQILMSGVRPESFANRVLLPAGVLMVVLGLLVLIRPIAAVVRPALTAGSVAIPLAGLLALDAVATASSTSGAIRAAAGTWWAVLAVVLALAAALASAVAGGIERDDVDLTERNVNIMLAAPVAAAGLFAIGAFGLPTMRAPEFVAPGLWSNFRLASWGLLIAVLVVLVIAVLATRSRPSRAVALLLGAAALVGVHALEMPLTAERVRGATVGPGTWLSLACIAALVISALVAATVRAEAPSRRR